MGPSWDPLQILGGSSGILRRHLVEQEPNDDNTDQQLALSSCGDRDRRRVEACDPKPTAPSLNRVASHDEEPSCRVGGGKA